MRLTIIMIGLLIPWCSPGQQVPLEAAGIETVIQAGHYAAVNCVAFSPDSRFAVTGSVDKTIKLWEVQTGREVRSYLGSPGSIHFVTFSRDGKYLASIANDDKLRLWDVPTSKEIRIIEVPDDDIISADFSPDGQHLVTGTDKNHVILWNFLTGENVQTFTPERRDIYMEKGFDYPGAASVKFSEDGSLLMMGSNDYTAILFDVKTGKEIRKFKADRSSCTSCNLAVDMSPDGKWLASLSEDSILIWDVASGKVVRTLEEREFGGYENLSFSQDGKFLIATAYKEAYIWNTLTGKMIRKIEGRSANIADACFSPDNQYILTGSEDHTAILWNMITGKEHVRLQGYLNDVDPKILEDNYMYWVAFVNEIKLSPDGKYVAIGKTGNKAKLMDFNTGRVVQTYTGHEGMVVTLDFSPDGKLLATGSVDGTTKIWEVETGKLLHSMPDYPRKVPIFSLKFSRDGKLLVTGGWDSYTTVWDVETGKWVKSIQGHEGSPYTVAFSHNGLYVISGGLDKKLKMFELDTGEEIREFIGHTDVVSSICILPDNKRMVTGSWDGKVKVWDLATGYQLNKFTAHTAAIHAVNIDKEGKYLVTGGDDNTARLWDLETGTLIRTFTGHRGAVGAVQISPDGSFLITGSRDGTIKTWDLASGKELLTHIFIGENDWLVKTPEGLFDASEGAKKSIFFVKGTEVYNIDQFFEEFYRPGLLQEVYKNRGAPASGTNLMNKLENSPPPKVEIISPEDSTVFTNSEVMMLVKIRNLGGGVDEVKLTQNGKSLPVDNSDVKRMTKKDQYVTKNLQVSLVPGENVISVSAFSDGRIESAPRQLFLDYKGLEKSANCYVVSIGINKYKNPGLDLNYARADAQAFARLIREKSAALFQDIKLLELYDQDATRANILSKLDQLAAQVSPEDVFFFYYAGHGSMVDNQFYFIPTESVSLYQKDKLAQESIQALEMQQKFRNIKALKQLVILDACQSGGSTEVLAQRGATEEKALAQLSRSSGVHVLAAAGSEQYASEFGSLGHGLFTFVILNALNGNADGAPTDGKVTIYELKSFIDDQVPELSKKYHGQPQYPYTFSIGQDFPVVLDSPSKEK